MVGMAGPKIRPVAANSLPQVDGEAPAPPQAAAGVNGFSVVAGTARGATLRGFQLAAAAAAALLAIFSARELIVILPLSLVAGAAVLQFAWGTLAIAFDAYALFVKRSLQNQRMLLILVVGDLVTGSLVLFAAGMSSAVLAYVELDLKHCSGYPCKQLWVVNAISLVSCLLGATPLLFSHWALSSFWVAASTVAPP